MMRVGRYTAALLIITLGVLLLTKQLYDVDILPFIQKGWPIFIILLGIEYIVLAVISNYKKSRLSPAWGSIVLSLFATLFVLLFLGFILLPSGLFQDQSIELEPRNMPVSHELEIVTINNVSGHIYVTSDDVDQIEARPTLFTSKMVEEETIREMVENTNLEVSGDRELELEIHVPEYRLFFFDQKPRVDIQLVVPERLMVDYNVHNRNGRVVVQELTINDELSIETSNGTIEVKQVSGGRVTAKTSNGTIKITEIDGRVKAETSNGKITLLDITGAADVETSNGKIEAYEIQGDLQARTSNGGIDIADAGAGIAASTSNGSIGVRQFQVKGDLDIETRNGRIDIQLPEDADASIKAKSKDDIQYPKHWQVETKGNEAEGTLGLGTYTIHLTSNSSITIQ